MAATIRSDIGGFYPETIAIAPGATLALNPIPGQIGGFVKYVSGGSLIVLPTPVPASFVGITVAATAGQQSLMYLVGATEVMTLTFNCPSYYFNSSSATCIINVLRFKSTGT